MNDVRALSWISTRERQPGKWSSGRFAKLILIYTSCFGNTRLWQLQNKLSLDWMGERRIQSRQMGENFLLFCETQTKAPVKLLPSYYANLLWIPFMYKLDHVCKIYFVVAQSIFGRMELFQEIIFLNCTLNLPFAGFTRDVDYSDGLFRSQFNYAPGQYLRL